MKQKKEQSRDAVKFNCSRGQLFQMKLLVSSSIAREIIDNANSFI